MMKHQMPILSVDVRWTRHIDEVGQVVHQEIVSAIGVAIDIPCVPNVFNIGFARSTQHGKCFAVTCIHSNLKIYLKVITVMRPA